MRVKDCFENFYGPDLVNTHKSNEIFYDRIFKEINLDPRRAIVIDDKPIFLEFAEKLGANVVQACLTGEFEPLYRYYVKHMNELPEVITKLLKKGKNKKRGITPPCRKFLCMVPFHLSCTFHGDL